MSDDIDIARDEEPSDAERLAEAMFLISEAMDLLTDLPLPENVGLRHLRRALEDLDTELALLPIPPIIVTRDGLIVDGNHRLSARQDDDGTRSRKPQLD